MSEIEPTNLGLRTPAEEEILYRYYRRAMAGTVLAMVLANVLVSDAAPEPKPVMPYSQIAADEAANDYDANYIGPALILNRQSTDAIH